MFSTKNYLSLSLIISQCLFYYPLRAAVSISLLHGCFWLDWHSWQHCAFTFCKKMLSNYQVPAGLASRNSVADVPSKFTWIVLWLIYHIPVLFNAFLVNSACDCSISVFILITSHLNLLITKTLSTWTGPTSRQFIFFFTLLWYIHAFFDGLLLLLNKFLQLINGIFLILQ